MISWAYLSEIAQTTSVFTRSDKQHRINPLFILIQNILIHHMGRSLQSCTYCYQE